MGTLVPLLEDGLIKSYVSSYNLNYQYNCKLEILKESTHLMKALFWNLRFFGFFWSQFDNASQFDGIVKILWCLTDVPILEKFNILNVEI